MIDQIGIAGAQTSCVPSTRDFSCLGSFFVLLGLFLVAVPAKN